MKPIIVLSATHHKTKVYIGKDDSFVNNHSPVKALSDDLKNLKFSFWTARSRGRDAGTHSVPFHLLMVTTSVGNRASSSFEAILSHSFGLSNQTLGLWLSEYNKRIYSKEHFVLIITIVYLWNFIASWNYTFSEKQIALYLLNSLVTWVPTDDWK